LLRAIAGVLNELGDAGRSLLLSWDGGRGEWGKSFDRKLDSIAKGSGKATLGSLFYLAKSEGWKPQRAIQSSSKPARKSAAALYPSQQPDEGSGKPEKQSKATLSFADAMAAIAQTYAEIESEAEQAWELGAIARKTGRRLPELLKIYELWEGEKRGFEPLAIEKFLAQKNPDTEWLIGDFLPAKTTGILYGDGGAGKSLFVYDLVKAIATGSDFCDRPTRQGKVLILQSDEPSGVTRERLSTAGFEGVPAETVWIERGWKSGQMRRLRQWLEKYSPDLVVIDSLAAIHRSSDSDENDAGYARLFFDLRDLQEQYGCTILMLHHANKAGGARGTSAIFDNVSEVFHLRKPSKEDKGLIDLDRVLEIPKTRVPRTTTKLVFRLNPDNYSWDERPNLEERPATLSDRLLAFLRLPNQRGVWIEPEELLQYTTIGGNRDTIRKALAGLARAGLVEAADRQGDRGRPYKVFRVPPTEGSQLAIDPDDLPADREPDQPESPPVTPAPVTSEPQPPPDEAIATVREMLAAAESDEERDELLRDAIACGLPVELIGGCHDFRL
jgi:archaellum biogenesis ATPase FlaH